MRRQALLFLLTTFVATATQIYLHDDGTAEFSTVGLANQALMVRFQALPNMTNIDSMQFYNFWGVANGHAIEYVLWSDPTNDGNPSDAQVVQSVSTTVVAPGPSGNWQTVVFPSLTAFSPGDWFYVGVYFTDPVFSYFLGGTDITSTSGDSWTLRWATNTAVDLNVLSSAAQTIHYDGSTPSLQGNLLIRAGAAEPIPEPGTFAFAAAGLLAVWVAKNRWA